MIEIRSRDGSALLAVQANRLRGADLRGADLRRANLRRANLRYADLRYADLRYADLSGADLRGAILRGADLGGADLRGAILRGADLGGADLRGAILGGANLRDAILGGATGIIDAATPDGWRACGWLRDGYLSIHVGCRDMRLHEAREYWSPSHIDWPTRREVAASVEYIAAIAQIREWPTEEIEHET